MDRFCIWDSKTNWYFRWEYRAPIAVKSEKSVMSIDAAIKVRNLLRRDFPSGDYHILKSE